MKENRFFFKCIVCDSPHIHPMNGYEKASLTRCKDCGMVFSSKKPTAEELENHYKSYGRNDYLSPLTRKRYHEILDRFEKVRKTNRILDVGCGIGYFLEAAKERNWEVYGTEYDDRAIHICEQKGIKMKKGGLNWEMFPEGYFDVISSFEVIEHINNPKEEIRNIHKFLRGGGYFYVTTPNFNSFLRDIHGADYNIIVWPEHLSYFTPKTLKRTITDNGFKAISVKATGISITRFLTSKKKSALPVVSKKEGTMFVAEDTKDEQLRKQLEQSYLLKVVKNTINHILSLTGKGDALKGLFVKKS